MRESLDTLTRLVLREVAYQMEENLGGSVMPFWAGHAWDEQHGGFLTRLDRAGARIEDHEKILIMQARMIGSLAAAHRHGLRDRSYLEMATRGFEFLTTHFWDAKEGGFHFSVTREGEPKCRRKNTDFHAYVITNLVELYLASKDPEVLAWAERVFVLLLDKAADGDQGFVEDFDSGSWPVLNSDQMHLGGQPHIKTIDMHTNVLEAFLYLARTTADPRHVGALRDLAALICARGIHPTEGCTITAFTRDWTPVADANGRQTTSYGLNVELAWLLLAAEQTLGVVESELRTVALGLIKHALDFGFDHERGGLAAYGPLLGRVEDAHELPPDRLLRAWWEQAEMLIALTEAFRATGDRKYVEALLKLWGWIWRYQIDHECGDWYQELYWPSGHPVHTGKGREWKTAFHVSRALIHVSKRLREISEV